jgi:hypothetical protein
VACRVDGVLEIELWVLGFEREELRQLLARYDSIDKNR